jgi:hypothetical protein
LDFVQCSSIALSALVHSSRQVETGGEPQLLQEVGRLEQWTREGRLDHVAPCEPVVKERDLESFLPGLAKAMRRCSGSGASNP